jgi:flagellar biosynthesis protein FlhF
MKIKKYTGADFQEAIQKAKKEMGQDAIILHTRHIKKGGFLGLFTRSQVEITVAADESLQVERDRSRRSNSPNGPAPDDSATGCRPDPQVPSTSQLAEEIKQMKEIMSDIKTKMNEISSIRGVPDVVQEFHNRLITNQVDGQIAGRIAASAETRMRGERTETVSVHEICVSALQDYINDIQNITPAPEKKNKVVAMVGPTGVGKTTTIAKLAASQAFMQNKKVAMITLDTYRISAAEQLRTYAEIIGVPLKVVFNSADLEEALSEFKDKDIIFIDTAGRSPFNEAHMEELKQFINLAQPDETILVLSVTTDSKDLLNIYQKFEAMNIDRLIFTKLDEVPHHGQILNALDEIRLPVAYFTTGQNVPDDIEVPEPVRFAQMLMGEDEVL